MHKLAIVSNTCFMIQDKGHIAEERTGQQGKMQAHVPFHCHHEGKIV